MGNWAATAAIFFSRLFTCADRLDWVLRVIESPAAAARSTALVIYLHYVAKITHLLVHDHPELGTFS